MTAQMADCCKYKRGEYEIIALSEPIRFLPIEYGLKPQGVMTSCWRGYWCEYVIERKRLKLDSLHIHTENDIYPDFCGRTVEPEARGVGNGHRKYENVNLPIPYTGRMLLGDRFIEKYYIHLGYQRAYAYKKLIELVFEDGILIKTINHSWKAKRIRKEIDEMSDDDFEVDDKHNIRYRHGRLVWK